MGDATGPKKKWRWVKFLPIVERELRVAARGKAAYRWRVAVIGMALGWMTLLTASLSASQAQRQGASLFQALVSLAAVYAFLAGVSVTADSVSREKREGTLGLLFLTDLRGRDVILGKLAANAMNTIYGLVGLLPLFAIPVMMGGVSILAGVRATLSVLNLCFVTLSLGMWVSTVSWQERRALFAAVVLGLGLMFGPSLMAGLGVYFGSQSFADHAWASLSPFHSLVMAMPQSGQGWSLASLAVSHLVGWLFLLGAGRQAQVAWQNRGEGAVRRTLDERVFTPRSPVGRVTHRRRLLEVHPLVWLLERHPGKRFYADILVFSVMAIWVWAYRTYGTSIFGGPTWFLVIPLAFAVHFILASWVVAESSMRLLEDRRSGALELMLCTSMTDHDIIQGHRLALRRLFFRPALLLAAFEVFLGVYAFGVDQDSSARNGRLMMFGLAASLLLDTHALSWVALRLAVVLPNVNRVGTLALLITPLGPVFGFALVYGVLVVVRGGFGAVDFLTGFLVWMGWVLLIDLGLGQGLFRRAVLREFRAAAVRIQPRAAVSD